MWKDGSIFYAIGAIIDLIEQKIQRARTWWFHLTMTKEQKRLQVLAGIREKE